MRHIVAVACIVAAWSPVAPAQDAGVRDSEAARALRTCVALSDSGHGPEAKAPGDLALALYLRRAEQSPRDVDALVGAARAMSQCLVPSAGFVEQGELTSEAMALLDRALEIQPEHFHARFVLASIAYRSPSFLGREKRAAQELDELLRRQGDRAENPLYARVFVMRGMLWSRSGQADSAHAVWARGVRLFPDDGELRRLADGKSSGAPADTLRTAVAAARALAPPSDSSSTSGADPAATLDAVHVRVSSAPPKQPVPSSNDVTRSQVLLTAGGTADVLQAVQMQPGVTRVTEGSDLYTRGGDASETALVVNGGRILSLGRFEGLNGSLFGSIEPFVVRSARYSSGGFSARHGNALSGVLEIETDGRPSDRQSRVGVSLVQASGTLRDRFSRNAGGWINARASHTAALLRTHGRSQEFSGAPHSEEMIGSIIAGPTTFTELRATAIVEQDDSRPYVSAASWRGPFHAAGSTRALLLSAHWMSSQAPLMVRASMVSSARTNAWAFGVLSRRRDEDSRLARVDAEWQPGDVVKVRAGLEEGAHQRRDDGSVPATESAAPGAPVRLLDAASSRANQGGGYGEAEVTAGSATIMLGMRLDRLPGETAITADPRVAVSARAGPWTARVSGGVFHQGRWRGEAAIPDPGAPSGLPLTARHYVAGLERADAAYVVRAEAFLKRYFGYRDFGTGPAIGRAETRGVDVLAQRLSGPFTGFVCYSLLDARMRLASGATVRSPLDVTHSATASTTVALTADWSVGTTARYGTGAPRTPIVGSRTSPDGFLVPEYGALMTERLPSYARLDERVMHYIRFRNVLLTTFMEVINLTNRGNISRYAYSPAYTSREPIYTFFAKRTIVVGAEWLFH